MRTIKADQALFPAGRPFHVASLRLARREHVDEHRHSGYAELVLVTAGRILHQVNGRTLSQSAGTLTLIRERDAHAMTVAEAPAELINLAFLLRWLKAAGLWDETRRGPVEALFVVAAPPVVELSGVERAQIEVQLRRLLAQANLPGGPLWFHRCVSGLLAEHLAPVGGNGQTEGMAEALPEWLARELTGLEQDEGPLPDTRELARRCSRVPEHLARTFRRCLGVTPSQYLNRKRLARAAGLLVHGNAKILDVCRLAGFHNLAYFYQLFRAEHALSPSAYRKRFTVRPPV